MGWLSLLFPQVQMLWWTTGKKPHQPANFFLSSSLHLPLLLLSLWSLSLLSPTVSISSFFLRLFLLTVVLSFTPNQNFSLTYSFFSLSSYLVAPLILLLKLSLLILIFLFYRWDKSSSATNQGLAIISFVLCLHFAFIYFYSLPLSFLINVLSMTGAPIRDKKMGFNCNEDYSLE